MTPIIQDNFLLSNPHSTRLFEDFARDLPIIDYHNHLPPDEVVQDRKFENLTQIWLKGDHYKWRAMRALGVDERFITGNTSDWEKFEKWANCVPLTVRNPLFHWTHLELDRYFGISELLKRGSAKHIYDRCNSMLHTDQYSTLGLLQKMKVEVVCTTDDPIDDLGYHTSANDIGLPLQLIPCFRPDKLFYPERPTFNDYVDQLSKVSGTDIRSFDDLLEALDRRMAFFDSLGCRLSDHGLDLVPSSRWTLSEVASCFKKVREIREVQNVDFDPFRSALMYHLGKMYHKRKWVMQLHLGALRNARARMMNKLGPDTGFDSIGDQNQIPGLQSLFDRLDSEESLPRTIVYNLNPKENAAVCALLGNYHEDGQVGKMQFGSAWWFLDQKDGIEEQLNTLSNLGILSTFIGMLTDSRSFLSFPRHEYFRRILCDLFGRDMNSGLVPQDYNWIGEIIRDICYNNVANYLNLNKST